jgi:hypothetical protein
MGTHTGWHRFTTKRFIFSMLVLGNATVLKFTGHLGDDAFALVSLGVIAGHQLENIVIAWRGGRRDVDSH